jgi:hypothetical protein
VGSRLGSLHRQHHRLLGLVVYLHAQPPRTAPAVEPVQVLLAVRGVEHHQVLVGREFVEDEVVYDAAALVGQHRVLPRHRRDLAEVGGDKAVQERACVRATKVSACHVAYIEHAPSLAHGLHLLQNARVLHGHLPACEGHHPRACLQVRRVECCALHKMEIRRGGKCPA